MNTNDHEFGRVSQPGQTPPRRVPTGAVPQHGSSQQQPPPQTQTIRYRQDPGAESRASAQNLSPRATIQDGRQRPPQQDPSLRPNTIEGRPRPAANPSLRAGVEDGRSRPASNPSPRPGVGDGRPRPPQNPPLRSEMNERKPAKPGTDSVQTYWPSASARTPNSAPQRPLAPPAGYPQSASQQARPSQTDSYGKTATATQPRPTSASTMSGARPVQDGAPSPRPTQSMNRGDSSPPPARPAGSRIPPEEPPVQRFNYGGGNGGGQPPNPPDPPSDRDADDESPKKKPRQKKPKPKKQYRVMLALGITAGIVGFCVFLAYFGLVSAADLLGLDLNVFGIRQKDEQVTVTVPEGASFNDAVKLLSEAGVVDSSLAFKLYAGLKDADHDFKPGNYMLNCKMGYDQVISALSIGEKERRDVVEIMFREGLTVWEIGKKLEEEQVCTAQEFVDELENGTFENDFVKEVPKDKALRFRRFEGYVYPDTYQFFLGEEPASVVRKFLNNFEARFDDDLRAKMKQRGLTLDETITLASIIQKEASTLQDMRMVSGVFQNRFDHADQFPQLQSDVTIFYVNNAIKPYLERADQAMYDAYNTYVCTGLPVGPICNPGMDAIEAALNPAENDYYFFVTDKNGDFYYAATVEEHKQNIATASQVGGVGGIDTED